MRFDTRDKKPKLWNVLIQAIFVAVVLLMMIRNGTHRHAVTISALIALFLLVFSAALYVSNISLICHEGKRLVSVTGILLSFLLAADGIFIFCFNY